MNRKHALFDEESRYNRMRSGFEPGEKIRGYFYWHQVQSAGSSATVRPASSVEARSSRPSVATVAAAPDDMLLASSKLLVTAVPGTDEQPEGITVVDPQWGTFDLRWSSGSHSMPPSLKVHGWLTSWPGQTVRAILVEPAALSRLRSACADLHSEDDIEALRQAMSDDLLRRNLELARIVSALPDIDGCISDDGELNVNIEAPPGSSPLPQDLYVVLAIDPTGETEA